MFVCGCARGSILSPNAANRKTPYLQNLQYGGGTLCFRKASHRGLQWFEQGGQFPVVRFCSITFHGLMRFLMKNTSLYTKLQHHFLTAIHSQGIHKKEKVSLKDINRLPLSYRNSPYCSSLLSCKVIVRFLLPCAFFPDVPCRSFIASDDSVPTRHVMLHIFV